MTPAGTSNELDVQNGREENPVPSNLTAVRAFSLPVENKECYNVVLVNFQVNTEYRCWSFLDYVEDIYLAGRLLRPS